jgi:thiol-disulfide isomerase/thioredoxin
MVSNAMAEAKQPDAKSKDLPKAQVVARPRSVTIDPVAIAAGSGVALLGVGVLIAFLWMVPAAAARESHAACLGMQGFNPVDRTVRQNGRAEPIMDPPIELCPGGEPCTLPVPAPDFTAVDITGKRVKLSDYRGKVVLLNFWASWCNVCKAEKPSLAAMAHDLGSNDFVVLTLVSDKNFGDAMSAVLVSLVPNAPAMPRDANDRVPMNAIKEAFDRSLPGGPPFNVLLDPPNGDDTIGPITMSWGIHAVPESALIDRKGNIRAYFVNKRDWEAPVARTCIRSVIDE